MRVTIGLTSAVMLVITVKRSQLFCPGQEVLFDARLLIIDKDRSRDMHGRDQHQALFDPGLTDNNLNFPGDIDDLFLFFSCEIQIVSMGFHIKDFTLFNKNCKQY